MSDKSILLVDDEASIIQLAQLYLEREGFHCQSASDGYSAYQIVQSTKPDIIVLDIMLPGMDGYEICRRLRSDRNNTPIIMLTARDEDIDKILGLELGADDYMTKPFNPRELVARVKAIFRRTDHLEIDVSDVIRIGDLEIDPARREVRCLSQTIDLRSQEFEVLLVLVKHKGLVLTREQLLSLAWGYDFLGQTRTVDVHIAQLRRKLASSKVRIETVTSVGYKLVV
jgi:DNA-binding response OmpR family regulator